VTLARLLSSRSIVFAALWLTLIAISVHDGYWLWANRLDIEHLEVNPQGRLLLHLGGGQVWLFLAAKLIGTVAVAAALLLLYWHRPRVGGAACAGVAVLQIGLLLYLYLA